MSLSLSAKAPRDRSRWADEIAPVIVRAILSSPHAYESADGFAKRVGLRNRHQLNRILHRAGFPGYCALGSFSRVLALIDDASAHHRSLCAEAIAVGYHPAWVYRAFRRVTGHLWSEVRSLSHDDLVRLIMGGSP